jgi:hypothetical protein
MTRHIEYYEYTVNRYITDEIQYFYMPVNNEHSDKMDLDHESDRIWKLDTKTNRRVCIKDKNKLGDVSNAEFLKIQLTAKPVPYNDMYHYRKSRDARRVAKK